MIKVGKNHLNCLFVCLFLLGGGGGGGGGGGSFFLSLQFPTGHLSATFFFLYNNSSFCHAKRGSGFGSFVFSVTFIFKE